MATSTNRENREDCQPTGSSTMDATVAALLSTGKGILAADESMPTIEKRFKELDIPCTEETRRAYREMLFMTPGLNAAISGVILFDETIRQKNSKGIPFAEVLARQGIIPGIKVDKGTITLPNFDSEKMTQGLDGLRERLVEYRQLGARFTKWRAVIAIGDHTPTHTCVETNARALALFAALSQEAGLVPIVEPEVLMNGSHSIDRCEMVASVTLKWLFDALFDHCVILEQMLLKASMMVPGLECPRQADAAEIAETTLRCLSRFVPAAVSGVLFLSGGQSDKAATERLNAICRAGDVPWTLSFSFARALQTPALKKWKGQAGNVAAAQAALLHRAQCNGLALQGKYSAQMECGE